MKNAPPIPTWLWDKLLEKRPPKKARKWVARWLDRHGVEAVYAEPPDLFEEMLTDILHLKAKSGNGG